MANKVTIVQHNVLAWTATRSNELHNTYQTIDPDIILINAHGLKEEERMKLFQYNIYQRNTHNEHNAGTAIAIKRNIRHVIIDDLEEDFLAIKLTTTQGPLIIATGYQPPRRPHLPNNTILRIFRNQYPVIFAGDINARHRTLDHGNNNPAGELINQMIRTGNTIHIGPDFKTYITPRASGTPDIVLTNNKINHNIQLIPGPLTTSDHIPIIIKVSASPIQIPVTPRLNFKKANWQNFSNELSTYRQLNLNNQPINKIDEQMQKWFTAVQNAMKNNIPLTTHRTLPHPKVTNEIKLIQTVYKNIQNSAKNTGWTTQLRTTAKILQNNLTELLKQQRNIMWEELLNNTEKQYNDPAKFWKQIKRLMGTDSGNISYILDPHGNKLTSAEAQANEFCRHLQNTFAISREDNANFCQDTQHEVENFLQNTNSHKPFATIDYSRLIDNNPLLKPITRNDVIRQIRSFKNKKAPGNSKINKTILLKLPPNMLDTLKDMFNAALSTGYFPTKFTVALIKMILKQGKQSIHPVNYRPISLLEIVGKTYEKILNSRLKQFLQTNNHNNPQQHAYQNNRGTISAIAITYETIAMTQQERQQCNMISRDISKAFDKVWHNGLKFKLCRLNMPRPFTASLCTFLDNRTAIVQIGNCKTDPFPLKAGVPQGSVLSPTLFNIYTADIGHLQHSDYCAYADDITQVISHHGASKEFLRRKTVRAIEEINEYERRWKIKTNSAKFQILHISKRNPLPITINGTPLQYVQSAKLLGLNITCKGITTHVKQQRNRASNTLRKLRRFKALNPKIKLHLYKALVLPIIDYPCIPTNTIKTTNWKKLQAIQNRALRWVNGDTPPYNTTTESLHRKYKLEPINIRNFRQAYKAWERVRLEFPNETNYFETTEFDATHSWWPLSYLPEDATEPLPIYKHEHQSHGIHQEEDDEDLT